MALQTQAENEITVPGPRERLDPQRLVDIETAAQMVAVSPATIRRRLTQKKLRRYKLGSRTLVRVAEVLGLVREA